MFPLHALQEHDYRLLAWPLEVDVREVLLIFVELHLPVGGVYDIIPYPAVLCDTILLL